MICQPFNVCQSNPTSFNQTYYHPNVQNRRFINTTISTRFLIFAWSPSCPPLLPVGIVIPLFNFTRITLVIFMTSSFFTFSANRLTASKGTPQVLAACIWWIRKKIYLTVSASGQTLSKVGLLPQYRSNNPIIAGYQPSDFSFSVPVGRELKKNLNLYYKKAKFSLISLIYFGMPSSYLPFLRVIWFCTHLGMTRVTIL